MRSIAMAMTWHYWRRNILQAIFIVTGGAALLALCLGDQLTNPEMMGRREPQCMIALIASIGSFVLILGGHDPRRNRLGFPTDLYTRPASTSYLVAVRMALSAMAAIAVYLGMGLVVWAMAGISVPILVPALCLFTLTTWLCAVVWSVPGSILLQMVGIGLVFALNMWWLVAGFVGPDTANALTTATRAQVLALIGTTALAYGAATVGVRLDRRGDRISLAWIADWLNNRIYPARRTDRPFRSARTAQFWFEWHRIGGLPAGFNLIVLMMATFVGVVDDHVTLEDATGMLAALAGVNVILYPILVAIAANQKGPDMPQDLVWATRSLSDNALLVTRLKVTVASLLAGWGMWLVGAVVFGTLLWASGQADDLMANILNTTEHEQWRFTPINLPVRAAVVGLFMWTALGIVGSMQLTGRRTVAWIWLGPLWVLALYLILVRQGLIGPHLDTVIRAAAPWGIGLLCLASTAMAFAAAVRTGRIRHSVAWGSVAAFLLICVLAILWKPAWITSSGGRLILSLGLLSLPLAPLATAPLALYWNRHR